MTGQISTSQQFRAWELFLRSHAAISRHLDAALQRRNGLTLRDYEVLWHLYRADEHRMRMSDLARCVVLTPSGVTRLVGGLTEAGFVERVACGSDARVTWTRLTDDGLERFEQIRTQHLQDVRDSFLCHLSPGELDALEAILAKLPLSPGECGSGYASGD